ncbi:hypothetical protein M413DRAFT_27488 [Hebeloma cylindrosporum]|uniref:DUF6533 domain-containing protein n=1 Tax=Hebeloma cylindrosporum TaxID=76867 RepID=A0A0C2XWA0_HEBCY|nr:hypothetical protein M413DRAFT_27488 [Hebeloma cylindrosporum h7]
MDITRLVSEGTAVNLVGAACLTLLLYDHAITLDQEVSNMWPTRFSLAKFLFIVNRYLVEAILLFNCISASRSYHSAECTPSQDTEALMLFDISCVFYLRWLTVYVVSLSSASPITYASIFKPGSFIVGILVLRVWALHRRNMWALCTAFFFYIGGTATLISLVIKDYVGEDVFINMSLSGLPGCYATSVPSIIAGFWIGPLIVETVLFLLVVSRALSWWKNGVAAPRIFSVLARDSTLYFTIVFALLLANYLVFQFGSPFLSSLLVTPSTTAGCILGSHMLLNLRALASARARDDPVTAPLGSVVIPLSARQARGENSPQWAAFDLTSGRLTSIQVTFDLERSRVAPFESVEPKSFATN